MTIKGLMVDPITNTPIVIEPTPAAALEMLAVRLCHDTVILCASPTGNCSQGSARRRVSKCLPTAARGVLSFSPHSDPLPYLSCQLIAASLLRRIREIRPQFPITC